MFFTERLLHSYIPFVTDQCQMKHGCKNRTQDQKIGQFVVSAVFGQRYPFYDILHFKIAIIVKGTENKMYYKVNIAHLQLDASLVAKTKENKTEE